MQISELLRRIETDPLSDSVPDGISKERAVSVLRAVLVVLNRAGCQDDVWSLVDSRFSILRAIRRHLQVDGNQPEVESLTRAFDAIVDSVLPGAVSPESAEPEIQEDPSSPFECLMEAAKSVDMTATPEAEEAGEIEAAEEAGEIEEAEEAEEAGEIEAAKEAEEAEEAGEIEEIEEIEEAGEIDEIEEAGEGMEKEDYEADYEEDEEDEEDDEDEEDEEDDEDEEDEEDEEDKEDEEDEDGDEAEDDSAVTELTRADVNLLWEQLGNLQTSVDGLTSMFALSATLGVAAMISVTITILIVWHDVRSS